MIFLAGSLNMNGGSTFLLRLAKELNIRGERAAIVVLSNVVDDAIRQELAESADVIMLRDLISPLARFAGTSQFSIFLPPNRSLVRELLTRHGDCVHVMGIFGLILAMRWKAITPGIRISAGVYHQNEFLFQGGSRFCREARALFRELPAENVVHFNEFTRSAYSSFFDKDYSSAPVLPIGIPIAKTGAGRSRPYTPGLLVSIGNLVGFKTYNEHVIRIVANLREMHPNLCYEIYGDGENEPNLRRIAAELDVLDLVRFNGTIPYERFGETAGDANAFIGSGTALIEAAALGVPSIVGVESSEHPLTYGLISDVPGLSYNEQIPGRSQVPMRTVIEDLLSSGDDRVRTAGQACAAKAREFSLDHTVEGFQRLAMETQELPATRGSVYWLLLMVSFVKCALEDRLGFDRTFRERRNQSSHA